MRLEMGSFHIKDVTLGGRTQVSDHTLVISAEELRRYLLEDQHFQDVQIHLARPGENLRLVHCKDIVEPRAKIAGPGKVFPGFLGPPMPVGEGRTHRLAGVALVGVAEPVPGEPTYWGEGIIDMTGPGAQYGPFGKTLNVVLEFSPRKELFDEVGDAKNVMTGAWVAQDYNAAITLAMLRAAEFLAQSTSKQSPHDLEVFELTPCDPALLKVACVYQHHRPSYYGSPAPNAPIAFLVHPNESFDGVLVTPGGGGGSQREATYNQQNNELLLELYRRHGKDINFVGFVVFGGPTPQVVEKERISSQVAQTIRLLGAQAAVLAGVSQSNLAVDFMLTCQKCEKAGVKTTLVYTDVGTGPDDPGFVFFVPEADAIVNTGSREQPFTFPKVQKVIGGETVLGTDLDAKGPLDLPIRYLYGANNLLSSNHLRTRFV